MLFSRPHNPKNKNKLRFEVNKGSFEVDKNGEFEADQAGKLKLGKFANDLMNLSVYFGVDPWYFYLEFLMYEFGTIFFFGLFGLFLLFSCLRMFK